MALVGGFAVAIFGYIGLRLVRLPIAFLVVGDIYPCDMPRHFGADLDDVPLDKGVVGPFMRHGIVVVGHAHERGDRLAIVVDELMATTWNMRIATVGPAARISGPGIRSWSTFATGAFRSGFRQCGVKRR